MKSFIQIALPHDDIIQGKLNMEVFAADLWQVASGKAPIDYMNPNLFFRRTYETTGLKNILNIAKERLEGKSDRAVIQLQTPFGGGKTHTLIALYHRSKEWNAKVVVIDGTAFDPREKKLWEELERQLTGEVVITKGDIAPGKEKLIELLSKNSPALILMDEILEYVTKAGGIKIGDSNLSAQTLAFIQELTGAVSTVGNSLFVFTLPSSNIEHYDENTEKIYQQLQKITGRTENIYTPVSDEEIEYVIRARLFNRIDEEEAQKIVDEFIDYARNEKILSENEISEYRERFLKSYPFKPEVIDVLYKRWGSFPTFQRTRGVLRLLSQVIYSLKDTKIPFIRLGDFDLSNDVIRRELIAHIGQEWDSIIAQDITSKNAGAKKVDEGIGTSYAPYKLGTVISTAIFMLSFSGKGERGTTTKELKLCNASPEFESSIIDTVINNLREKLFYLSDDGLFFTNQPNLNKIMLSREENVPESKIYEKEREILQKYSVGSQKLKIYLHPKFSKDIPDTPELKLAILNKERPDKEFLENCGESPRVYRNTLIFLCTDDGQKESFHNFLRKLIATKEIESDKSLNLSHRQREEITRKLKELERREYEELRKYYRKLFVPDKNGFKEFNMGIPNIHENQLNNEVYEYLRSQGEILEKISPVVIKEKYLSDKDYIPIKNLYNTFLTTPGETRLLSRDALKEGIMEGVKKGLFGFGYINYGEIVCVEDVKIEFEESEIIIKPELCKKEEKKEKEKTESPKKEEGVSVRESTGTIEVEVRPENKLKRLYLKLKIDPKKGETSQIIRIINLLKNSFSNFEVEVTFNASDGEIDKSYYENNILEAFRQARIEIIEEKLN